MGSRATTAEMDEANGLFTKRGFSIKFCFHPSVRQGRGRITEDIERHGGRVVANERQTNVLLVDEEENITLIRRRYYSSSELYRLSIFVEPRGFVRHCINSGYYGHVGSVRQGMPGPVPGADMGRVRVPFTSEDRQHLAQYMSTIFPTRDGRLGMTAYKQLEQLGQQCGEYEDFTWAKRHTAHSWREHYKKNQEEMDRWIAFYARQLEGLGHNLGQDRRARNLQALRQEEEKEEEEEVEVEEVEVEEEGQRQQQQQPHRRREEQRGEPRQPAQADAVAREYLARHEQDLVVLEEEEEDAPQEEGAVEQGLQRAKRHHPDAHRQRSSQALHAKRARVAVAASRQDDVTPAVERGRRRERNQAREEDAGPEESPEVEGSDPFGDREYEKGQAYDPDNIPRPDMRRFSPEVDLVADDEAPPAPTQATLVASPEAAEKHVSSRSRAAEAPATQLAAPPSSQATLVMTQERVAVQRVRGASVQPGPSQPRSLVTQRATAASGEGPYRNTRARSRSVEPPPPAPQRREAKGKGKARHNELVRIPEVEPVADNNQSAEQAARATSSASIMTNNGVSARETFEDERVVEDLLEASDGTPLEIDDDEDDDDEFPPLPPFQDIEVHETESEPSDSDDAETHRALELSAKDGPVKDDRDDESGSEREEEDDEDRIHRMASRSLTRQIAPSASNPPPRTTRSMTQLAAHVSPRKTRLGTNQTRDRNPQFPSLGTKARAVVDRVNEAERNVPYAPPAGSQAAKALRRRG